MACFPAFASDEDRASVWPAGETRSSPCNEGQDWPPKESSGHCNTAGPERYRRPCPAIAPIHPESTACGQAPVTHGLTPQEQAPTLDGVSRRGIDAASPGPGTRRGRDPAPSEQSVQEIGLGRFEALEHVVHIEHVRRGIHREHGHRVVGLGLVEGEGDEPDTMNAAQ